MQGLIEQVSIRDIGSSLAVDHAAGATDIYVANATDFSDYGGDTIEIEGLVYGVIERDDGDTEDAYDKLVLDVGLAADVEAGSDVFLLPRGQEKVASVLVDDDEDDSVEAVIPFNLTTLLVDGIREPDDQEMVEIEINDNGDWEVVAVVGGELPILDGAYLGGDLPDLSQPVEPPAFSPDPIAYSGSGVVVLTWPHVELTTSYDLHAFVMPPEGAPLPAVGPATLHTSNANSPSWVDQYNGSPLPADSDTYFALVARNSVGAAAPSAWVPGRPGPLNTVPLTASLALLQNVISELVQTAGIEIGTGSWSAAEGFNIPGVVTFPVDGTTEAAVLYAEVIARAITIQGFLSMRGKTNTLEPASELGMAEGIAAPKRGPAVDPYWPVTGNLIPTGVDMGTVVGMHRHSDTDYSLLVFNYGGFDLGVYRQSTMQIRRYVNGVLHSSSALQAVQYPGSGLIVVSNRYYWISKNVNGYYQIWSMDVAAAQGAAIGNATTAALGLSESFVQKPCITTYSSTQIRLVGFVSGGLVAPIYPMAGGAPVADAFAFTGRAAGASKYDVVGVMYSVGGASTGGVTTIQVISLLGAVEAYRQNSATAEGGIVRSTADDFPLAYGRTPRATSGFYSVDYYGGVSKYRSTPMAGLRAAYSWADLNPGGTGEHETPLSPPSSVITGFPLPRGANARITAQEAPELAGNDDSPTDELIYVSNNNGPWYLLGAGDSLQSASFETPPTSVQHGARGVFPVTLPALIRSAAAALADNTKGMIELRGDGSGQVGPYEWDKLGVRVDEAWRVIGATGQPAFVNGVVGLAGWTPKFRKDVAGNVHLRGLVTLPAAATAGGTVCFTLPAGYRPTSDTATTVVQQGTAAGQLVRVAVYLDGKVEVRNMTGTVTQAVIDQVFSTR